jgi:hypothetical protein
MIHPLTFSKRALHAGLAAVLLSAASGAPALAQDSAPTAKLSKEQLEKIFPERRTLLLEDLKERRRILETSERCINGARQSDALKECLKSQRKSEMTLRQKERDGMRRIFARNGINAPVGGPGGKGKSKSKGQDQGSQTN